MNTSPHHPGAVSQSALSIRIWGVRGSIPTPGPSTVRYGGNTSCIEVRAGGHIFVLDAGTGIRNLGTSLLQEFRDQPILLHLLLTHTHWDHIQGFPFFAPAYRAKNQIRVLGCEGAKHSLAQLLSSQMESPFFPVGFKDLPSNVLIEELTGNHLNLHGVSVRTQRVNHPGLCVGYRLQSGNHSIAYVPDNELALHLPTDSPIRRTPDADLIRFLKDVDIAFLDTQYTTGEYPSHLGWGHGCLDDVVRLACQAQVRQLYLFHHDPDHDDDRMDALLAHARDIALKEGHPLRIGVAQEGLQLQLGS